MKKNLIGEGKQPLICTPLVGKTEEEIGNELKKILAKKPDIIEWRVDFFENIHDSAKTVALANHLKKVIGDIPMIFTIRSIREGGQPISLSDKEAIELNVEICRNTTVEYVDCELSNESEHIRYLRKVATEQGTKIIGSFHNFECTPSAKVLSQKFTEADQYQLDVAKVAVMPQTLEDVLILFEATLAAKNRLTIPLITMSMGKYGAISRIVGGVFGSALSFAVGDKSSAPGQIPIEDLRMAFDIVERSMSGE